MKNRLSQFLLLCFALLFSQKNMAQWYDPEKVNKKAAGFNEKAYMAATDGKYPEAISFLNQALQADPKFVDAVLSRAGIYGNMKNYTASVTDYEKALEMDRQYAQVYLLPYSISLAGTGNFEKALETVNVFLQNPKLNAQSKKAAEYRKGSYEFAIAYAKNHPAGNYVFAARNMGENINSQALEYFPSLTIDGSKMIYTRRENSDEDFYVSDFLNGQWSKALPIAGKINTNFNEGAQNISQDGDWLIFTGCNYPEGRGSCDLYISFRTKRGGWTEPENLPGAVNTEFWESSPSLSPDKKDLYFSSNRTGGYGGADIWVSHRLAGNRWSNPENLGSSINTGADEGSPFIHADNQTLYFNSSGQPGYGNTDLFLSRKTATGEWQKPENLGYPINTIDDEGSLIVASDGKTSYYASDGADTKGGLDIYSFKLRDDISALKTLWVKGKVYDKKTGQGLPSSIELTEIGTKRAVSRLQTDEEGNYLVTLPLGRDYAFNVNRKGYLFYSDNFSLKANVPDSALRIDIPLQPLEAGASIVLKNIFFDTKKWDLKTESQIELDKLVQLMTDNPTVKIEIAGHTDNVGKTADNLKLSNNRAKAVVQYLLSKGIAAGRLSAKGFAEKKPIAPNTTDTGRAQNRRTEVKIISVIALAVK